MKFSSLIKPMSKKDFLAKFESGTCFVIRGKPDKFKDLITLDEIEARLNDGSNLNTPVQIIQGGQRGTAVSNDCAWSQMAVKKREVLKGIKNGCSIMMANSTQINPRAAELIDGIEATFKKHKFYADLHLYVSSAPGASAYNAHRDFPQHKIYLQVIGKTQWTIFSHDKNLPNDVCALGEKELKGKLKVASKFTLKPGDMFYMPPSVFHRIANAGGPRVSFSIPFCQYNNKKPMDRTYIPFKQIFESHLNPAG